MFQPESGNSFIFVLLLTQTMYPETLSPTYLTSLTHVITPYTHTHTYTHTYIYTHTHVRSRPPYMREIMPTTHSHIQYALHTLTCAVTLSIHVCGRALHTRVITHSTHSSFSGSGQFLLQIFWCLFVMGCSLSSECLSSDFLNSSPTLGLG